MLREDKYWNHEWCGISCFNSSSSAFGTDLQMRFFPLWPELLSDGLGDHPHLDIVMTLLLTFCVLENLNPNHHHFSGTVQLLGSPRKVLGPGATT